MLDKPRLVALNKMDTRPDEDLLKKTLSKLKRKKLEVWTISGVSGENIEKLKIRLGQILDDLGAREAEAEEEPAREGDDW